jgi:hypothetical protein
MIFSQRSNNKTDHHNIAEILPQESERSCICVLGVYIFLSFYDVPIRICNCSNGVVLMFFIIVKATINHESTIFKN